MPRHAIDLSRRATLESIGAMLVAQAVFTANDACMKLVTETLPLGEALCLRNGTACLYLLAYAAMFGGLNMPRHVPSRAFGWRIVGEILSTFFFFTALSRMPIADLSALSQIAPLALTAAGALFLGEPTGWRRWMAALVGFLGVMLILQPGSSAFNPASLLGLAATAFGVLRDLTTRAVGLAFTTLTLVFTSIGSVFIASLSLALVETWVWPTSREIGIMLAGSLFLIMGYVFLIRSLRQGDLAAVNPFRYSAILWAIVFGWVLWGELPGWEPAIGIAIVVAAGLYTLHRERLREEEHERAV
jgi:drug/metabolite transporter (DMT)-like permease